MTESILQFGALGLLGVFMWLSLKGHAKIVSTVTSRIPDALDRIDATLDKLNATLSAFEVGSAERHGMVLATIESVAKETRHSLRDAIAVQGSETTEEVNRQMYGHIERLTTRGRRGGE